MPHIQFAAGDAAHVHPPLGGQGLNTGVQDAVNLGWKLGQVVKKASPQSLLETNHDERHPVGARVLQNTMAQVALTSPSDRHQALRNTMTEQLSIDEPRQSIAAMMSGLGPAPASPSRRFEAGRARIIQQAVATASTTLSVETGQLITSGCGRMTS